MTTAKLKENYEKHLEANWQWVKEYTRRMNKTCNPHLTTTDKTGVSFCLECHARPEEKPGDVFIPRFGRSL